MQVKQSRQYLCDVGFGISFRDFVFLFDLVIHVFVEVSLATKLENSSIEFIFMVLVFENVDALDNVGMVEFADDIDFLSENGGIVLSEGFEDFHGKNLFGLVFDALVDVGVSTETDFLSISVTG